MYKFIKEFNVIPKSVLFIIINSISILMNLLLSFATSKLISSTLQRIKTDTLMYLMIVITDCILMYVVKMMIIDIRYKLHYDMETKLFDKVINVDYSKLSALDNGSFMQYFSSDCNNIVENYIDILLVITRVLTISISIVILLKTSIILSIVSGVFLLIMYFISLGLIKKIINSSNDRRNSNKRYMQELTNITTMLNIIKFNGLEKMASDKYNNAATNSLYHVKLSRKYNSKLIIIMTFISDILELSIVVIGLILVSHNKLSFVGFTTFVLYIPTTINMIMNIADMTADLSNGYTSLSNVIEISEYKNEIVIKDIDEQKHESYIELNNVSFSYPDTYEHTLNNVTIHINKNMHVGICGKSGSGKSTLIKLLLRLYDTTSGNILINGFNIKSLHDFKDKIGIVSQDMEVFNGSIYENITYSINNTNKVDVIQACKRASIYEFIMSLEKGFDTMIGEKGMKLSGGQKQRLCIARVLLKNPDIIIFDEATSALDNVTEKYIKKQIDSLSDKL